MQFKSNDDLKTNWSDWLKRFSSLEIALSQLTKWWLSKYLVSTDLVYFDRGRQFVRHNWTGIEEWIAEWIEK